MLSPNVCVGSQMLERKFYVTKKILITYTFHIAYIFSSEEWIFGKKDKCLNILVRYLFSIIDNLSTTAGVNTVPYVTNVIKEMKI